MKNKIIVTMLITSAGLILSGCQGDDRLQEVSSVQSEAQLQKEKEFRDNLSLSLEQDLARRQAFYQNVAGSYEGKVQTPDGEYFIRVRLEPTVYPVNHGDRIRFPDEVIQDLNKLQFRAQIVQWKEGSTIGVIGCRVENILPDLINGSVYVSASDCPGFYKFYISNAAGGISTSQVDIMNKAEQLANSLMSGSEEKVTSIIGEVYPTSPAERFYFTAERKE